MIIIGSGATVEGGTISFSIGAKFLPENVTVEFAIQYGSATQPDLESMSPSSSSAFTTTIDFPEGFSTSTIDVLTFDDNLHESTETFSLVATVLSGDVTVVGAGIGTIEDNEIPVCVAVEGQSWVVEGDEMVYTISLNQPNPLESTAYIYYEMADITAIESRNATSQAGEHADYYEPWISFAIPPGQVSATHELRIPTYNDDYVEGSEWAHLVLMELPDDFTACQPNTVMTIVDNDLPATVSVVAGPSVVEGEQAYFDLLVSEPNHSGFQISFATENGSAFGGQAPVGEVVDYQQTSGAITFEAGQASHRIFIDTFEDFDEHKEEADEDFRLSIFNPSNGIQLGTDSATGVIIDDDVRPTLTLQGTTVSEGDGTADAIISLNIPVSFDITFGLQTADRSAVSAQDYTAVDHSSYTILAGSTSFTVSIPINDDTEVEPTEHFDIELLNVVGADVAQSDSEVTILDNDREYTLEISDDEQIEGNEGYTSPEQIEFPVQLTPAAKEGDTIFVEYDVYELTDDQLTALYPASSDPTQYRAHTPGDWVHLTNTAPANRTTVHTGIVEFTAGSDLEHILIDLNGDLLVEVDEKFGASIANFWIESTSEGHATITATQVDSLGTITDDDVLPEVSISDDEVPEGDALSFSISLNRPYPELINGYFSTSDQSAVSPDDYESTFTIANGGSLGYFELLPGETSVVVEVTTINDLVLESTEEMTIELSSVVNAEVAKGTGVGTILDDEREYVLRIDGDTKTEGNAYYYDPELIEFTVSVSPQPTDGDVITADWMLRELTDDELILLFGSLEAGLLQKAVYDADWLHGEVNAQDELVFVDGYPPTGSLSFHENSSQSAPVFAPINGDWFVEMDEFFAGLLTGYSYVSGASGRGITLRVEQDFDYGIIIDDDDPIEFDFERIYDGNKNCECCSCASGGSSVTINQMEGVGSVRPGNVPGSKYQANAQYDTTQVESFKVDIGPLSRQPDSFRFNQFSAGRASESITVNPGSLDEFAFGAVIDIDRTLPSYHGSAIYLANYELTAIVETGYEPIEIPITKELPFPVVDDRDSPGGRGWRPDQMMKLIPVIPASGEKPASLADSDGLGIIMEDGTPWYFEKNDDGSFSTPNGLYATLVEHDSNSSFPNDAFSLWEDDRTTHFFDSDGMRTHT
ncbi:Calx-beta domain-containing protein, partial [Rhodopirellula bahusiensis]